MPTPEVILSSSMSISVAFPSTGYKTLFNHAIVIPGCQFSTQNVPTKKVHFMVAISIQLFK